jgi:uncharacterized protein (DUF1697 family)
MNPSVYVAFLRGINVGGNAVIKMSDLKELFETLGFKNVTPVLASGNVLFETAPTKPEVLKRSIERILTKEFNVPALAIIRTGSQLLDLAKSSPFKSTKLTPRTKLHITFLAESNQRVAKLPYRLPCREFEVIQISSNEVASTVEISPKQGTPELMRFLEKEFGKNITTRTWNTVQKLAGLMAVK